LKKKNKSVLCSSFVEPDHRGKVIFDLLFKARLAECKSHKIEGVATKKSRSTYLRYGFAVKRETKKYTFFERG